MKGRQATKILRRYYSDDIDRRILQALQNQVCGRRKFLSPFLASSISSNAFSTLKEGHVKRESVIAPNRPWLDRKVPVNVRTTKFVETSLGSLGQYVVANDAIKLAEDCCKLQDYVGLKFAHDVLDRVLAEKRYFDSNEPTSPPFPIPEKLFEKILYGWCHLATKGKVARIRMREILDLMMELEENDDEKLKKIGDNLSREVRVLVERERLQPTVSTYNTVLTGLRNAAKVSQNAATEAEELLDEMTKMHKDRGWHTRPNTKSYSLVISAYANSGLKYSGKNAERLLRKVQQSHEEEKKAYLEQYGVPYKTMDVSGNKRRIVTADAIMYNSVIQAYSQRCSPYEARKARDLLIEAMNVKDGTVHLDLALFTSVINSFANVAQNMKLPSEKRYMAAEHAEEALQVMVEEFKLMQDNGQLDFQAENDKNNRKGLSSVAPFNACINAYAKCGSPKAAYKAEAMLQKLLTSYNEGQSKIKPDTISFNSVLSAWSRCAIYYSDAPQKAEELLNLQLHLVESGALDAAAMPDSQTFSVVISTFARSNYPEKVQHAYRVLQRLLTGVGEGKVLPGKNPVVPFTAVINAVAHTETGDRDGSSIMDPSTTDGFNSVQKDDDYTIALQTYREMKEDVYSMGCKPDHITFATMLHAIGSHTKKDSVERRQMVQVVFDDACEAGEVSKLVMKALRSECPDEELYASLVRSKELAKSIKSVDELPRAWTRNVSQKFRILKRDFDQVERPGRK